MIDNNLPECHVCLWKSTDSIENNTWLGTFQKILGVRISFRQYFGGSMSLPFGGQHSAVLALLFVHLPACILHGFCVDGWHISASVFM